MGTITLKVPQDIQQEYQIDNAKMAVQLLFLVTCWEEYLKSLLKYFFVPTY